MTIIDPKSVQSSKPAPEQEPVAGSPTPNLTGKPLSGKKTPPTHRFFSVENPLWTVVPIVVSVAALFFAYKSMTISRETNDVHIRLNEFLVMSYIVPSWQYTQDGYTYYPGTYGDGQKLINDYTNSLVHSWSNDLSMRWMAPLQGTDPDNLPSSNTTYYQYFHYLMLTNDSTQNAWGCTVYFNHYSPNDKYELRGRDLIPSGADTEVWTCGPTSIAPKHTLIIPIGTSYMRYDESIANTGDYYTNTDVQRFGDGYDPVKLTFRSGVSGIHSEEIELKQLDPITFVFTDPPLGPLGDEIRRQLAGQLPWLDAQGRSIIDRLAPQPSRDAIWGN